MDDAAVFKIEAQLSLWSEQIKRLEARLQLPGRQPRFAAVLHVDELRIMLVTARARFTALRTASAEDKQKLTAEFDRAWQDLAVAIDRRMPRP